MTSRPPHDLLRAQIEGRRRPPSGIVGRLILWLSRDARAMAHLDAELARVRVGHLHEVQRLRALLAHGSRGAVARALALDTRPPHSSS